MAEDLGERTEEATPKRRQEAREEGQVARSQDLAAALILLASTLAIWAGGWWMLSRGSLMLGQVLSGGIAGELDDPIDAWSMVLALGAWSARIAGPVLLLVLLAAVASQFVQVGWLFAPKAVVPKLSKLDPISGARRVFGLSGLVKVVLDLLKVTVVVAVSVVTIVQHGPRMIRLPHLELLQGLAEIARLALDLSLRVVAVLLLLGILDFIYQKWKHGQDLRMTKQQVKDEMKQTEGDPEVKRRRLRMQQQIALQRIGAAVPKADVVVTNPEHVAVAIRYDEATMGAPRVVAKGADHLALRIRQIAARHGVPVIERKPLARALYRAVEVGREIPPEFYKAVAEILAYVYQLDRRGVA